MVLSSVTRRPTTTNYTYNAANQLTSDGTNSFTYDANGNLTSDDVNAYTWDRANRLLSMGDIDYAYDGAGRRVSQEQSSVVTEYLLDVQPELWTVLAGTASGETTRYLHGPRGIHGQQDDAGNWGWIVQDALGSVRSMDDASLAALESRQYEPYGDPFGETGANQSRYGYTGEYAENNGLVHLRVRYYDPVIGRYFQLDPSEQEINPYEYGSGNPIRFTDPNGQIAVGDEAKIADSRREVLHRVY